MKLILRKHGQYFIVLHIYLLIFITRRIIELKQNDVNLNNWALKTSKARPNFRVRTFCLVKKNKSLDLLIFSRIGKTMKKLQWIPNTILNTMYLIFWCLYIWRHQTDLFNHGMWNISLLNKNRSTYIQEPCKNLCWNFL